MQPYFVKEHVVCGNVYGGMHYKDLLGSTVRVAHCIPVQDFYHVLHDFRCLKSTLIDQSINQSETDCDSFVFMLFTSRYHQPSGGACVAQR